jgi:hypothetical protein
MTAVLVEARLEGPQGDRHQVYLGDLKQLSDQLSTCLGVAEKAITKARPRIKYRIENLGTGSLVLTLGNGESDAQSPYNKTVALFNRTVSALQAGAAIDPRIGRPALESFRKLVDVFLRRNRSLSLNGVELTTRYIANIDDLLKMTIVSEGSFKGRIERLNIHNKNEFALYTPLSEHGVVCTFDPELFQEVRDAIGKSATVSGKLHFHGDEGFPAHINVNSIVTNPDDDELPTLASLRGIFPASAFGNQSAIEFIQTVRDEQN